MGTTLLPLPLHVILSATQTQSFVLNAKPVRKLQTGLRWIRGHQTLEGQSRNLYSNWEFSARYDFRLLGFEAGYSRYDQIFFVVPGVRRGRFFFRVTRPFRIL